jgi:hypothetical protein
MTFEELLDFVKNRMQMSHVYQPLVIQFLARAGGAATLHQLATEMAAADEAAVSFYSNKIATMPVKVLRDREVVTKQGDLVSLTVKDLSYEQRAALSAACEARVAEFLRESGIDVWSGFIEVAPVPGNVRYDVLARDRKCQLCGRGPEDAILQVDHIVPRAHGGSNDPANLQVLCAECNQGKGARDNRDFRGDVAS